MQTTNDGNIAEWNNCFIKLTAYVVENVKQVSIIVSPNIVFQPLIHINIVINLQTLQITRLLSIWFALNLLKGIPVRFSSLFGLILQIWVILLVCIKKVISPVLLIVEVIMYIFQLLHWTYILRLLINY